MKQLTWLLGSTALVLSMWACGGGDDGSGHEDRPDAGSTCGDGTCQASENQTTCPADCKPTPPPSSCGNKVCEVGETTSCPADCPASLKTVNNSSYTVYTLYVAKCEDTTWGVDQTGSGYIAVGTSFTLNGIPPGCYEFKAENTTTRYWQSQPVVLQPSSTFTWTLNN